MVCKRVISHVSVLRRVFYLLNLLGHMFTSPYQIVELKSLLNHSCNGNLLSLMSAGIF